MKKEIPKSNVVSKKPVLDPETIPTPETADIRNFYRISDQDIIDRTINIFENDHVQLSLVSKDGLIQGDSVVIKSDRGKTLTIDKPHDFNWKKFTSIRLFFLNTYKAWDFFETKIVRTSPDTLVLKYPKSLYQSQRRTHERLPTPIGSTAFFHVDNRVLYGGLIKDMSPAGMLIHTWICQEEFAENTPINGISIVLPGKGINERDSVLADSLLVISKGIIVRSFRDSGSKRVCHGVSFDYSSTIRENLDLIARGIS